MKLRRFWLLELDREFEGFDTGESNGVWDCPTFNYAQARRVAKAMGMRYDRRADEFILEEDGYRARYPAYSPDGSDKYYALGWKVWGWEAVIDEDD